MKDPAFLFYYSDFIVGTTFMSNEAVGAYIRCLCYQADKGSIPENHMKIICNSHEIYMEIKNKFLTDKDTGNLYNERLRIEVEKRKLYSESRKQNKLGKKKKIISKSYENHMGNININVNKDIDNNNNNEILNNNFSETAKIVFEKINDEVYLMSLCSLFNIKDKNIIISEAIDFAKDRALSYDYSKTVLETRDHFKNRLRKMKDNGKL